MESAHQGEGDNAAARGVNKYTWAGIFCAFIFFFVLPVIVYIIFIETLARMAIGTFLDVDDIFVNELCGKNDNDSNIRLAFNPDPRVGCSGDGRDCDGTCFTVAEVDKVNDFFKQHPAQKVTFKSRDGGKNQSGKAFEHITLRGWLLRSEDANAPRIAVQHGYTANGNKPVTVFAAYLLRKIGFTVLVNNFRDHCYSNASEQHTVEWGHAYPFDLLGAWDYLKKDPDGVLGGHIAADKVGVLGFSMGAFTASNVMGLEEDIPGAWLDSPFLHPSGVFAYGADLKLQAMGLGFLSSEFWVIKPVWKRLVNEGLRRGVDLTEHLPEKLYPKLKDNTHRPLMWVHNKMDGTVPYAEGEKLNMLVNSFPNKFDASKIIFDDIGKCQLSHCGDIFRDKVLYEYELCKFWKKTFKTNETTCVKPADTELDHDSLLVIDSPSFLQASAGSAGKHTKICRRREAKFLHASDFP